MSKFLFAVKNSDHTIKFSQRFNDLGFGDLQKSLNENLQLLKHSKLEKEAYFNFLNIVINKLKTGIICIEKSGKISLINNSAKTVLEQHSVTSWDQIQTMHNSFYSTVNKMKGDSHQLVEIKNKEGNQPYSVILHKIQILKKSYRIISFQNIKNEIEIKELEAWNKLVKILNHEIMNSVTPLASLTDTILMLIENDNRDQKELSEISDQNITDIKTCVKTIKKRSQGLLDFVEDYRKLSKLPPPRIEQVSLKELFENISNLMRGQIEKHNIKLSVTLENNLNINADPRQIEQVLINMINNSFYFLKGKQNPRIDLAAEEDNESLSITISDNGPGIPEDDLEKIFVPFYSTKPAGTGIGLSLCRQIMLAHNGKIIHCRNTRKGACFRLIFPV